MRPRQRAPSGICPAAGGDQAAGIRSRGFLLGEQGLVDRARDERRHVVDLLRGEIVLERRHRALTVRDPLHDLVVRRRSIVEIGSDASARPGCGERMAAATTGRCKDLLAVRGVALGRLVGGGAGVGLGLVPSPRRSASARRCPRRRHHSPPRPARARRGRAQRRRGASRVDCYPPLGGAQTRALRQVSDLKSDTGAATAKEQVSG